MFCHSVTTVTVCVKPLILCEIGTDTILNCHCVTALWYIMEMEVNRHTFINSRFSRELGIQSRSLGRYLSCEEFVVIIMRKIGWALETTWTQK